MAVTVAMGMAVPAEVAVSSVEAACRVTVVPVAVMWVARIGHKASIVRCIRVGPVNVRARVAAAVAHGPGCGVDPDSRPCLVEVGRRLVGRKGRDISIAIA